MNISVPVSFVSACLVNLIGQPALVGQFSVQVDSIETKRHNKLLVTSTEKQNIEAKIKNQWIACGDLQWKDAQVAFIIHNDGCLSDVHIEKSSGVDIIDKMAISAVNKAVPLGPLRLSVGDSVRSVVTFQFQKQEQLSISQQSDPCDKGLVTYFSRIENAIRTAWQRNASMVPGSEMPALAGIRIKSNGRVLLCCLTNLEPNWNKAVIELLKKNRFPSPPNCLKGKEFYIRVLLRNCQQLQLPAQDGSIEWPMKVP